MRKRGLGRNLGAILSAPAVSELKNEENTVAEVQKQNIASASPQENNVQPLSDQLLGFKELPVEQLQRGEYQPRREMDDEALNNLAQSIKAQGVLQPIIVRKIATNKYEIIAGERRWRASQRAGLTTVPVVIKAIPDEAAMAIGLIENVQRENLNPIEEAMALDRLSKEFELTHLEVAESVGRSRAAVSNLLRLLNLAESVQKLLQHGDLEMGHARALLGLPQEKQLSAARHIIEKSLSVRETEAFVKKLQQDRETVSKIKRIDSTLLTLQQTLSSQLGSKVQIQQKPNGKGKLVIQYESASELESVLAYFHKK